MARRRAQSPLPSTSQAKTNLARDVGSDDDDGHTESQQVIEMCGRMVVITDTTFRQMLALRPLLKKPKTDENEIQQFNEKVVDDQNDLKALLEHRMRQV